MNQDKEENPSPRLESINSTDGYPLIQKINQRPVSTALNGSLEQSIEYSTYDPAPLNPQPQPIRHVVTTVSPQSTQDAAFNPAAIQARVKKCSCCLVTSGWILAILGGISLVSNVISMFATMSTTSWSWPDVDGQKMTVRLGSNTMFMFALFKIVSGALTLWQGKVQLKVFKPILKEYRNAERGVTQGIVMDKRRSKKMAHLKKKIAKITVISFVVGFLGLIYYQNFQMDMVDQYLDQKYEFIQKYNETHPNSTYNVEKIQKENFTLEHYNKTHPNAGFKPKERHETYEPEFEPRTHPDWPQVEDGEWNNFKQPMNASHQGFDDDYEFNGTPFVVNEANITDLWGHHGYMGHHGGHHGPPQGEHSMQHHGPPNGEHPMHHNQHDQEHRQSHKDDWKKKRDPYKEWLDKLPYMSKDVARGQAYNFWNMIICGIGFWCFLFYAIQQGFIFYCINQCIKSQKVLEDKYMGPEIVAVQPTQRQVAASTTTASQPVIQYIVQPPQPIQTSATGNIVSANQIV